jgi:hypothetical protein
MKAHTGRIAEILVEYRGEMTARIDCPPSAVPAPGQYTLAEDPDSILAVPLFLEETLEEGFLAAPPVPQTWEPGLALRMRGPLGHGFRLPAAARRIALATLENTAARLLPLLKEIIRADGAVALFSPTPLPPLPPAVEAYPLIDLPDAVSWADFLAADVSWESLPELRGCLGLNPGELLPCPGQALVFAPMPCGGLAGCGACAVHTRRGWKLACLDGPVFDLNELEW